MSLGFEVRVVLTAFVIDVADWYLKIFSAILSVHFGEYGQLKLLSIPVTFVEWLEMASSKVTTLASTISGVRHNCETFLSLCEFVDTLEMFFQVPRFHSAVAHRLSRKRAVRMH